MLTYDQLAKILHTNHQQYIYTEDFKKYGVGEYWMTYDEIGRELIQHGFVRGDCDDMTQMNRRSLKILYNEDSQIVTCGVHQKTLNHAVCYYNGWILDNRFMWPMKASELKDAGYHFIAISGFNKSDAWHEAIL